MTAAPKSRRHRPKVDEAPSRAIEVITRGYSVATILALCAELEPEAANGVVARGIVSTLAAEGLQIVDAADRGRLQHEIDALRAKLATAQQDAARFAHAAEQLDEAHADAQAQLALALHWGAALVGQYEEEIADLYIEQAEELMCSTCGGAGGFNDDGAICAACGGTGNATDELKVARKALLDAELAQELQRFEYGRLVEAERGRVRALELELARMREGT